MEMGGCQCADCLQIGAMTRGHHPGCPCQACRSDAVVGRVMDAAIRREVGRDMLRVQLAGLPPADGYTDRGLSAERERLNGLVEAAAGRGGPGGEGGE